MLTLIAATALVPIAYSFPMDAKVLYDVGVKFEGYIPVLGGQEGKVEVAMRVAAKGLPADTEKRPQVSSEIETFKIAFNGSELPLGVENVQTYFPKTTTSITPQGKVEKSDAPEVKLPVRLPGLDVKRFPDISYLPIQFPTDGIEKGKRFTYLKSFGDSDVSYTVIPIKIDEDKVALSVYLTQTYDVLEDEAKNVVEKEVDAVSRVMTKLEGKGTATFDRKRGIVSETSIAAKALSVVTDLKTKERSTRKLDTLLEIKAVAADAKPPQIAETPQWERWAGVVRIGFDRARQVAVATWTDVERWLIATVGWRQRS